MVEIRRRAFILEPGESLLLTQGSLEVALRFGMWERFTQLPARAIVTNPIAAAPLIDYPPQGHPAQVWQQVNPASLWHPLMWLPARLAGRYQIEAEDGTTTTEDDDTWAVRVCLELTLSGMYDPESGTWVDVLSMFGLDIDDPDVLDRVRWWQTGEPDPILDAIDLATEIDVEDDRHWALETAAALMDDLRPASWALLANDLLATIDEVADPGNPSLDSDPSVAHQAAGTILSLGRSLLSGPGIGLDTQFWDTQDHALAGIAPEDFAAVLDGPVAAVSAALYEVRDANWSHLDALETAGREPQVAQAG